MAKCLSKSQDSALNKMLNVKNYIIMKYCRAADPNECHIIMILIVF